MSNCSDREERMEDEYTKEHVYNRSWTKGETVVIDCKTCGYIHLHPIPSKEKLMDFYGREYHSNIKQFDYSKVDDEYVNRKLTEVRSQAGYLHVYNLVNRYLTSGTNPGKMLDIGCGNELLSVYFREKGWSSSVIEPNQDAVKYLRKFGVNVHENFAEDLSRLGLSGLSFVNIQYVLEHVSSPELILKQVHDAMEPGGLIRICVPNDFSAAQMAYQEFYNQDMHWVADPDHINYFSYSSLNKLLNKAGFDEVYRTTNFPVEFFLLGGMNYYTDDEAKKNVGPFIQQFHQAFVKTGRGHVLGQLYRALADLELGRSIVMIARKR